VAKEFIEKITSEQEDQNAEVIVYRIANYPADYTLQGLYEKWKEGDIIIPSFQRGFVWKLSQASKLIESFLLGLPVPSIFLYKERHSQKLLVVDGQQRLKTIFGYVGNNFPDSKKKFSLRDVHQKWIGISFLGLEESDKRRLKDSVLRAVIIDQLDPKDNTSIFHIFHRLNTGGTVLKAQEVRNCIYQGKFNRLLKELNENPKWRRIIGLPKADRRMRDIELILRFLALRYEYKYYRKPMKDFLSDFMSKHKNDNDMVKEFKTTFTAAVSNVNRYLGPNCFRRKAGLNAAVFDSVMVAFSLNLNKIHPNIKDRYRQLGGNEAFDEFTSANTTDEKIVKQRISLVIEKLFRR